MLTHVFVCMPVFLVLAARVSNVCVCILSNCQPFNSSQCPTENKETLGIHLRVVGDWTGGLTHTHTHTEKRVTHSFYSLSKLTGWKLFCFVLSAEDTFLKSCILMCVIIPCFFLLVCVSECVQDSFFTSRPRLFPQVHHLPR